MLKFTAMKSASRAPGARLLAAIETVGNALPQPATLFALLALGVVVLSAVLAAAGLEAPHPRDGAAVRACVPVIMARWNLARLTAYVNPRNLGSIGVLEAAGFVREGLVRARAVRDGEVHDHLMYGLVDASRLPRR